MPYFSIVCSMRAKRRRKTHTRNYKIGEQKQLSNKEETIKKMNAGTCYVYVNNEYCRLFIRKMLHILIYRHEFSIYMIHVYCIFGACQINGGG